MVSEQSAREAYRRALDAHRRATATHEAAADIPQRAGKSELAAKERAGAVLERERLGAALLVHPGWVQRSRAEQRSATPRPTVT